MPNRDAVTVTAGINEMRVGLIATPQERVTTAIRLPPQDHLVKSIKNNCPPKSEKKLSKVILKSPSQPRVPYHHDVSSVQKVFLEDPLLLATSAKDIVTKPLVSNPNLTIESRVPESSQIPGIEEKEIIIIKPRHWKTSLAPKLDPKKHADKVEVTQKLQGKFTEVPHLLDGFRMVPLKANRHFSSIRLV